MTIVNTAYIIINVPTAMIVTQDGSVREIDGIVEVCVNVTNANNIPIEGAEIIVSVLTGLATSEATRNHKIISDDVYTS